MSVAGNVPHFGETVGTGNNCAVVTGTGLAMDEAAWDRLVGDLYLSATDTDAAGRLPGRLSALVGGAAASVWRLRVADLSMVGDPATSLPAEAVAAYRERYFRYDPWAGAVHAAQFGTVLFGGDIVEEATLARSLYYNEFGAAHDMFHMLGVVVPLGGGRAGAVTMLRSRAAGPFDSVAAAALNRAIPHIAGGFALRDQVDAGMDRLRAEALGAALDAFGVPAVVLDGHGTVLRTNAAAETLGCVRGALARRTNPHGTLRMAGAAGLPATVAAAARGNAGGRFRWSDGEQGYVVTVTPLPERLARLTGVARGRALMLLRPLAAAGLPALAAAVFGLTGAEARAVSGLAEGLSPAEIAAQAGVKVSTVRTQLGLAQDKMGCRNLRDVVRVMTALG